MDGEPRWAAVVVNYHGEETPDRLCPFAPGRRFGRRGRGRGGGQWVRRRRRSGRSGGVPGVTVLDPRANLGYARAANLGIAATPAPVVASANPDTTWNAGPARGAHGLRRRSRSRGGRPADPQRRRVAVPLRADQPGPRGRDRPRALGRVAPRNRSTRRTANSTPTRTSPRDVDWVSGAFIWFRRSWLDRAGGWDERFFLFMEDIDVCRAIGEVGGRIRYEPGARVSHVVGASRSRNPTGRSSPTTVPPTGTSTSGGPGPDDSCFRWRPYSWRSGRRVEIVR